MANIYRGECGKWHDRRTFNLTCEVCSDAKAKREARPERRLAVLAEHRDSVAGMSDVQFKFALPLLDRAAYLLDLDRRIASLCAEIEVHA